MYESAAQRSKSICRDCEKNGNNHGTFTMKVVTSVIVVFATRWHDILYSDWEEKILHRSVQRVELTCTQKDSTVKYYRCFNYFQ